MKGQRGKKGIYVVRANKGLLSRTHWQPDLHGYPISLISLIREKLQKKQPGITEKFNSNSHYFGYWLGDNKDRVYIYVQKKQLVIDLSISPDFVTAIKRQGFKVKSRDNFQEQNGWLTGWQVPQSTANVDLVINWICKAFEDDL